MGIYQILSVLKEVVDKLSPYIFILCAEILSILIRNSKNVNGIVIEGVEYKLTQYADDTTFLLDGSSSSLESTLNILEYYAVISGLKINYSKTKAVWIGSKKYSKTVFHKKRWKLDWESTQFSLLGIKFDVNLENMSKLNFEGKLGEIKKIIHHWLPRKLTPIGRNTIIKSLLIPKITHLLITLPNPPEKFIKELNALLLSFLWNKKPPKIKKEVLYQNISSGGLRMVELNNFIVALKITWIRRLITTNVKWSKLFEVITQCSLRDLTSNGDFYMTQKIMQVTNSFWKDVLYSWKTLQLKQSPCSCL